VNLQEVDALVGVSDYSRGGRGDQEASQAADRSRSVFDIVGYSEALTDEQQELVDRLSRAVRNSDEFQKAAAANRLLKMLAAAERRPGLQAEVESR